PLGQLPQQSHLLAPTPTKTRRTCNLQVAITRRGTPSAHPKCTFCDDSHICNIYPGPVEVKSLAQIHVLTRHKLSASLLFSRLQTRVRENAAEQLRYASGGRPY